MSARWLCDTCEDRNQVELSDASGCYPTGEFIDCEECPTCDCGNFISRLDKADVTFDEEEYAWRCPDCREPTPIQRAAELPRQIMAQMAASQG